MVPVIKSPGPDKRVGGKITAGVAYISQCGVEPVLFVKGVIILEAGDGGIVGMEVQLSEFFDIVVEEGYDG
jgi:hypothetical protein